MPRRPRGTRAARDAAPAGVGAVGGLGVVIATRTLAERGQPTRRVVVRVGQPVRVREGRATVWACPYQIRGIGDAAVRRATGEDALQALEVVLAAVRHHLVATGRPLHWLHEEVGLGIARHIPYALGTEFEARLHRVVDREVARFVRRAHGQARGRQVAKSPRR